MGTLIETLARLALSAEDPPEIAGYEVDSADWLLPRQHRVSIDANDLAQLTQELRNIPEIASFEDGVIQYSPDSHGTLSFEGLAHWLLAQARFRPAQECVADLFEILKQNSSDLLEIVPIWGISPLERIDLGDGTSIIPVADLPESRLRDLFMGKKRHQFSSEPPNSWARPGAALTKTIALSPIYEDRESKNATAVRQQGEMLLAFLFGPTQLSKSSALTELSENAEERMKRQADKTLTFGSEELLSVIALCIDQPIFALGHWYQHPPPTPLVGTLAGYSGPTNDHPFHIPLTPKAYPTETIEEFVRKYKSLDESTQKRLRTPLIRFNQGRRQRVFHTREGAAIDFGISAEALLTSDRDSDAPIAYTLRARGTLLLGGSPEERMRNYSDLKTLYDLRSKVAHEGALGKKFSPSMTVKEREAFAKTGERLKAAEDINGALLRKVIELGKFPSWDALMFGW